MERERLLQELDHLRSELRGSQGLTAEAGALRGQLVDVIEERDQLRVSLFQQMDEVTGLVVAQIEHHQSVARAEARLAQEREASRLLREQLSLVQGLFPQGYPATTAIEFFLGAWRDIETDAQVGFFEPGQILQRFRTVLRDFCLWLEPLRGPLGNDSV